MVSYIDDEIHSLEKKRVGLLDELIDELERAVGDVKQRRSQVDSALQKKLATLGELQVLVRWSPGPAVERYHSAMHPCGRVTGRGRDRRNFEQMTEGDAQRRGLRRCSACNWWRHENDEVRRLRAG